MDGWRGRLVQEWEEVSERELKLSAFVDSVQIEQLDSAQQWLIRQQLRAMQIYSLCLAKRLELLKFDIASMRWNGDDDGQRQHPTARADA
jgi:hypothetical protein